MQNESSALKMGELFKQKMIYRKVRDDFPGFFCYNGEMKRRGLKSGGIYMFDLAEELKKLPDKPGVYLMHSKSDEIIYVGKAINLKNRVRQYFQTSRIRSPKIEKMVSRIAYFEYIITDSELEALVL